MYKLLFRWLLLPSQLFLIGLSDGMSDDNIPKQSVILAADVWCPYNCEPGDEKAGYVVELAKEAFRRHGRTFEYRPTPWNRALIETTSGNYDGVIGAVKEEAPNLIFPNEPIGMSGVSFATKATNSWRYKEISDLKGVRVGIIPDYFYGDELDAYFSDPKVKVQKLHDSSPLQQGIKLIQLGRLDAILDDNTVLLYTITQMGLNNKIVLAGQADEALPLHIGFSPKGERGKTLAREFTTSIQAMRSDGTLQAILSRYGLLDWKQL